MLVDLSENGTPEIVVAEVDGDSIRVHVIDATGAPRAIGDPAFDPLWPLVLPGQRATPMAIARTSSGTLPARMGVVIATMDTLTSRARVTYTQIAYRGGVSIVGQPVAVPWTKSLKITSDAAAFTVSPPVVGDIDGDGHDEVVVTLSDGRIAIIEDAASENGAPSMEIKTTRSNSPSSPSLADVDQDGSLEIALWDDEWMYLMRSNGEVLTNWPRRAVKENLGEQPPITRHGGLESPVMADVDGDGIIEILFPLRDGSYYAFGPDGTSVPGFPRVGVSDVQATPTIVNLGTGGGLSLISLGAVSRFGGNDPIHDEFVDVTEAVLSIQSLPGTDDTDLTPWSMYQGNLARTGTGDPGAALVDGQGLIEANSFMIYPNPVTLDVVNARVMTNSAARVRVDIYNLEGESTFSQSYTVNPNGLLGTPFDEAIDVSNLVSGVYFLRLYIESTAGAETLVKPFAVRR